LISEGITISPHFVDTMADTQDKAAHDAPPAVEEAIEKSGKQDINPWSVSGEVGEDGKVKAIDYNKLTSEFGTTLIDNALLERFEKVTGHKPHRFLRRQIVFSHRDLTTILDRYEKVTSTSACMEIVSVGD
jgi:tryptophanyl-tRNA synthetase